MQYVPFFNPYLTTTGKDSAFQTSQPSIYKHILEIIKNEPPIRSAIVHAEDEFVFRSSVEAARMGIITPIFIGSKKVMQELAEEIGVELSSYEYIDSPNDHKSADIAIKLAREEEVHAIIKGKIHTEDLMYPIVQRESGMRQHNARMSHAFIVAGGHYHKPLLVTDAAINIQPDLATKREIVQNAIDLFHAIFDRTPKVAILSAVEIVTCHMPATLDAAALCKMAERDQITGAILDGPLAFDNAISAEAARTKQIRSQVAGDPDILIVPNIESGNILYKQMRYAAKTESIGLVMGAKVPIVLTSRSEEELMSRIASCASALAYAKRRKKQIQTS